MKIILATPVYPPEIGGPATYTKELANRLKGDHEVGIVAYASASEFIPGTKLYIVSKRRPLPLRLAKFFFTLLRVSKGADVIYVQNAMAAGLPAIVAGRLRRIPVILKFVGDEAWERASQRRLTAKRLEEFLESPEGGWKIRLMMAIEGFVLRRASVVTTPSAYLREALVRTYGVRPERAVTNYNAAEPTETLPFDAKRVKHQIATTARLVAWKGIDGILRAVALLKERYPDVRLMIAGDGPEMDNLKRLAVDLRVADRVAFLGNVSRAETWQLRKNSEVYVLNSTYEGLPHTVLTSFAAGIPTVATNIPGTNEAVYDGATGLLVEAGNDRQLAGAIATLFEHPELGLKLAAAGTELLERKFSWDAHMRTLLSLLETVVAKPINKPRESLA